MEPDKIEFNILYGIPRGKTNFNRLNNINAKKIVSKLQKNNLIKFSYRNGEIYGFIETLKEKKVLHNSKYQKWYIELGD